MNDCYFYGGDGNCNALSVEKCPKNCQFKKTEFEFTRDVMKAGQMLKSRGLRTVIKDGIVTVEKIGDTE